LHNFIQTNNFSFEKNALKLFNFQAKNNLVYKQYIEYLEVNIDNVSKLTDIPFLPISFFKTHKIICKNKEEQLFFLSSGTSGIHRSKHSIADVSLYIKSFISSFTYFYGNIEDYCIQALLPSYLENENSSLIYMINHFIKLSTNKLSSYVSEKQLIENIDSLKNKKVLLIGVSYALLDLADKNNLDLSNYTIMETGGMKGRKKELTRKELHSIYKKSFNVSKIDSEYGMTELLSQAYSKGNGVFKSPPWMKIMTRPISEPFSIQEKNKSGVIKVIDLANIYSCAFIETADLGIIKENNSFEILGRVDFEDIRGCNLMINS